MNRILIVDDDKHLVLGLTARLRAHGYEVLSAPDAAGAIARARADGPGLLILDLGLPSGDGFAVLERLKGDAGLSQLPVIVLSARDPAENARRAIDAGALAFIQKPPDNQKLLDAIRAALMPRGAAA